MINLIGLVAPLIAGIGLGFLLREKKHVDLGKVTFGVILALIFSLGFSIGENKELLEALPRVGVDAVVIAVLAMFFSAVFVVAARKAVGLK